MSCFFFMVRIDRRVQFLATRLRYYQADHSEIKPIFKYSVASFSHTTDIKILKRSHFFQTRKDYSCIVSYIDG